MRRAFFRKDHLLYQELPSAAAEQVYERWQAQVDKRCRRINTLIAALVFATDDRLAQELAMHLMGCAGYKTRSCNLSFCPACKARQQQEKVQLAGNCFGDCESEQLRFLTWLLPVTYDPEGLEELLAEAKKFLRRILRRHALRNLKIMGNFEVAVKLPRHLDEYSRKTLVALGMDNSRVEAAYLLHLHAIVDLNTREDPREVADGLCTALKGSYTHKVPYGVVLKEIYRQQTLAENLTAMANYLWKCDCHYGDDLWAGKKDKAPSTALREAYETPIMVEVAKIYQRLGNFQGMKFMYNL